MRSTEILQSRTGNENIFSRFRNAIKKNWELYLMFLPVAVFYIMFCYRPMYGIIMAFQDYVPRLGISGSSWTGFLQFERFFSNHYFWRLLKNTFTISGLSILVGFPAPIIFALLLNEIKNSKYKRTVQTITYLPHFISIVVICSMIRTFTADNGVLTNLAVMLGGSRKSMLNDANLFVPIYVLSDIWQNMGWSSIIYIAALSGINTELYEAAQIDGANRWKQVLHVTLPGIMPTITIMLILRLGGVLSVGYEKIILLYNPVTYKTADVISTYVYRQGLLEYNWSYSAAVGLFNSVVNFLFLITSNRVSKKLGETSLW